MCVVWTQKPSVCDCIIGNSTIMNWGNMCQNKLPTDIKQIPAYYGKKHGAEMILWPCSLHGSMSRAYETHESFYNII